VILGRVLPALELDDGNCAVCGEPLINQNVFTKVSGKLASDPEGRFIQMRVHHECITAATSRGGLGIQRRGFELLQRHDAIQAGVMPFLLNLA
jgi:hypothetical protein